MQCESCQGTMLQVYGQEHSHCAACNTFEFPTSIDTAEDALEPSGKTNEFQCPKCDQALELGKLRGMVDVCFCSNCRGFVIDSGSLGDIVNELRGSYEGPDDKPRPIDSNALDRNCRCPACLDKMDAHPYYGPGNVVIDTCMHCKLAWFDHGELAKIVRAPGKRPDAMSTGNFESQLLRAQFDKQVQAKQIKGQGLASIFFDI